MNFPENLKYTKEHEWIQADSKLSTVGITDHAQNSLGEIVFLELPAIGRKLTKGETFGVVESIKAVSDLYSPVTGEVKEVNSLLVNEPGNLNTNPYGSWLIKIEATSQADDLLSQKDYSIYVASLI